jgi:predicted nucleotidyltransferase
VVDAYAAARDFVRRSYPHARIAFLGGSAASGTTTSTSDLDIFVVLDDEGDVSYVETTTHEGWLVEAFVYSPDAVQRWLQKGRDERRPVLDALAATGLALTDNDETQAWAERARAVLAAGPGDPDPEEVDVRRYTLSALLDDLECADPGERYVVAATAFREAAELTLLVQRRWLGSGKWLVRNLRSADDHGLVAWAAGVHDPAELAAICRAVLTAAGGYLQSGFVRGERPRPPST